jgi:predicted ATP-dependent serine protease
MTRLVGRDAELDGLAGWVRELAAGRGRAALVDGEPGIGKSALLRAAADRAAQAGCAVFWGAGGAGAGVSVAAAARRFRRAGVLGRPAPG